MTDRYIAWKGWDDAPFGECRREDALYYECELSRSGISSVRGMNIGELGYGNGAFAGWVTRGGATWIGREVIPELEHRAANAGFRVIRSMNGFANSLGPEQLDLVVAFDVIEHLDVREIRAFLEESTVVLKAGGLVVFRLPSGDSPFSGAVYWGDLTHRTLLGSSAARQLALEAGLEVHQIRAPAMPLWGLGPLRTIRRLAVRLAEAAAFGFIRNVLMRNRRAVLTPDMVVVLRKKAAPN